MQLRQCFAAFCWQQLELETWLRLQTQSLCPLEQLAVSTHSCYRFLIPLQQGKHGCSGAEDSTGEGNTVDETGGMMQLHATNPLAGLDLCRLGLDVTFTVLQTVNIQTCKQSVALETWPTYNGKVEVWNRKFCCAKYFVMLHVMAIFKTPRIPEFSALLLPPPKGKEERRTGDPLLTHPDTRARNKRYT